MQTAPLKDFALRLIDLPDRVRVAGRVARQSGLLCELRAAGLRAALKGLVGSTSNPSLVFRIHAANTPDKIAVKWRDRSLTFAELDERLDRVGAGLARRGFKRGTSIVLMMKNRPEFIELQGGATRIGA